MDISKKCRKVRMEERIMPIKLFWARWRREIFQAQYPMWNCSWLTWKWKVISAMDTNMKCKEARMEEGIMPIKSLQAGWKREAFQTEYPMWNCSWLPWKGKIISVMDTNMKYKKVEMEEGIMPIISLQARWRKKTFQAQYPMSNCSWLPWKCKVISAMDTNMKCKEARMEEGIMPIKSLQAGWRREAFQTQYPMWNCSWLPWKWKIIYLMDSKMKYKKAGMEEGIMPIKSLQAKWRRDTFQTQYSMWNCSWIPWK